MKRALIGTLAVATALALAPLAQGQGFTGPYVVIDENSIDESAPWYCATAALPLDPDPAPDGDRQVWTAADVNDNGSAPFNDDPEPGERDSLRFFQSAVAPPGPPDPGDPLLQQRVEWVCGDGDGVVEQVTFDHDSNPGTPDVTVGEDELWITTGTVSDPGWWQLRSIPDGPSGPPDNKLDWVQQPVHSFAHGWLNFFNAEEGLGSHTPDCSGGGPFIVYADGTCASQDREALMDEVPDVHRVGINDVTETRDDTEWNALITAPPNGTLICALVHDSDPSVIEKDVSASFKGDYLGTVAFRLLETRSDPFGSTQSLPQLKIRITGPEPCEASSLAVTFQALRATRYGKSVLLRWTTASEIETLGFNVYRSYKGKRIKLNTRMIPAASLLGGAAPYRYSFRARIASARLAAASRYWIQEVELDRTRNWYGPVRAVSAAARAISLP